MSVLIYHSVLYCRYVLVIAWICYIIAVILSGCSKAMFHISLIGFWCILDTLSESEEEWMRKHGIKSYGGDRDVYEV